MGFPREIVPYACPVAAGVGLSTTVAMAVVDWTKLTGQATAALALAGLVGGSVVGGFVYLVRRYDMLQIERQRLYDEANKTSISAQMKESLSNQEKMRESLHKLNGDLTARDAEKANLRHDLAELRDDFMAVSRQLRETDDLLHKALAELRTTALDRDSLRAELATIRSTQVTQGVRLGALETGSGPHPALAPPGAAG